MSRSRRRRLLPRCAWATRASCSTSRMAPGGQSGGLTEADMGKAKMRVYGNVSIPQEAFIAALRMGNEG